MGERGGRCHQPGLLYGQGWIGSCFVGEDEDEMSIEQYAKMTKTFSQGVVHVGINYRLGALGFTALEGETWGNQGLRDQVEGVRVFIVKRGRFTHHGLLIKKK